VDVAEEQRTRAAWVGGRPVTLDGLEVRRFWVESS
jgi:hypothetical protein